MREIREGDLVTWLDATTLKYTVEVLRDDAAWLSRRERGKKVYVSHLVRDLTIAPSFEVGKTYRHWNLHPDHSGRTVTVSAVSELGALGWWSDGKPWGLEHSYIEYWVEVTEKEAAITEAMRESADFAAEQSRKLTRVMVTTYHPENYRLRNLKDGTEWEILGGTWVQCGWTATE